MFINEIIKGPVTVEGRRFVERTINSKFERGKISITTTYMDNKPLLKQYAFCNNTQVKNVWKEAKTNKRIDIVI